MLSSAILKVEKFLSSYIHFQSCLLCNFRKMSKDGAIMKTEAEDFQVGRDLIEDETAAENRVKTEIYVYYAKAVGLKLALLAVLCYALFQGFTVGANLWLSVWSEDPEAATDTAKRNLYLGVYGTLGFLQVSHLPILSFDFAINYKSLLVPKCQFLSFLDFFKKTFVIP